MALALENAVDSVAVLHPPKGVPAMEIFAFFRLSDRVKQVSFKLLNYIFFIN